MPPTPAGSSRRLARPAGSCTPRWPPWDHSRSSICSRRKACRPRSSPAARSFRQAIGRPTCWRHWFAAPSGAAAHCALAEPWWMSCVPTTGSVWSHRNARLPPKRWCWPPAGSRIPLAARRATAIVGPPRWGTRSSRRARPWCRSPPRRMGPPLQGITVPDVVVKVIDPGGGPTAGACQDRGPLAWPVGVDRCCSRISECRARWFWTSAERSAATPSRTARVALRPAAATPRRRVRLRRWPAKVACGRTSPRGELLDPWLPHRVAERWLSLAGVPLDRTAAEFSKEERRRLGANRQAARHSCGRNHGVSQGRSDGRRGRFGGSGFAHDAKPDRARSVLRRRVARSGRSRSAATTSRPPSAPAGWPAKTCNEKRLKRHGRRSDRTNASAIAVLDTLDRNGQWRQFWPNAAPATT